MFIFSFTKKPVNKTVKDSHNKMISQQDIKLEDTKRCFYSILHKKTDLKSARQDLQGKGNICLLFLGTSTSLKQASEWNSSLFFMIPVSKSLSKKKKKEKKITSVKCQAGHFLFNQQSSIMSCSSFFHPCRFWFGNILIVRLIFKFFTEVMNCFIQTFFQWDLFPKYERIIITLSSQQHLL